MPRLNWTEDDLKAAERRMGAVRGRQGKHLPLRGVNDGPVPNETDNSVRNPRMAGNKDTALVSLRGKSVDALDCAGRGEAYSPEAGHATKLRTKESERRTNACERQAPSPTYRSKLESAWAQYLDGLKALKLIDGWRYEPMNFRLPGKRNFYKIDFITWIGRAATYYEVKGRNKSDDRSLVKMKTAAGMHPWATFILVKRIRGQWEERTIS